MNGSSFVAKSSKNIILLNSVYLYFVLDLGFLYNFYMVKIAHINLSVSNMEKSTSFYDKVLFSLGFTRGLNDNGDWGAVLGYKGDGIELEIIHENNKEYKPFNRFVGLNHICFEVEDREKVDEMYELVKTLDVKITRKPREYPEYTDKYYAFYFRDPDGIPLEIAVVQ